jgi:FHS family Na+ dependent glucose MFS transporter 1
MASTSKRTKLIATTAYYLAFITLGLTTAISGPSLPTLAENTSSGVGQISLIFVFGSFGYLVGSYFGGRAFDRIPGHKLMAGVLLLLGISSVFIPISHTLGMLLLFMFLSGIATGTLDVGSNTLLLWTHREESGPFINGLHFFFGVGAVIAPLLLVKVLVTTGTINWTYWTFAIVCLPIAIWLWFLPEPSHQMHSD